MILARLHSAKRRRWRHYEEVKRSVPNIASEGEAESGKVDHEYKRASRGGIMSVRGRTDLHSHLCANLKSEGVSS